MFSFCGSKIIYITVPRFLNDLSNLLISKMICSCSSKSKYQGQLLPLLPVFRQLAAVPLNMVTPKKAPYHSCPFCFSSCHLLARAPRNPENGRSVSHHQLDLICLDLIQKKKSHFQFFLKLINYLWREGDEKVLNWKKKLVSREVHFLLVPGFSLFSCSSVFFSITSHPN